MFKNSLVTIGVIVWFVFLWPVITWAFIHYTMSLSFVGLLQVYPPFLLVYLGIGSYALWSFLVNRGDKQNEP